MKKRWVVSAIGILGVLLILYFVILKSFRETSSSKNEDNTYFELAPITKWTKDHFPTPCLSIQIEDQYIASTLDLGFRGYFSLSSEILDQIEIKKYLKSKKMYGHGGKEYEKKVFDIPEIRIGRLSIYHPDIQEEAVDFHANGALNNYCENPSTAEPGRIGWEAFQFSNLLLDLGNKTVAFCDSLSTLKNNGYAVETFVKTPLITERGFVEIDALTSYGQLRCVLDTGSTFNILNVNDEEGGTSDKFVWNPEKSDELALFKISEKSFGPITFYRVPIQLPIQVDAFLGMEFFNDNIVFLDFKNNMVYIGPSTKNSNPSTSE